MRLHLSVKSRPATVLLPMFVDQAIVPSASCNTKPLFEVSFKVALFLTGLFGLADHGTSAPYDATKVLSKSE